MTYLTRYGIPLLLLIGLAAFVHACSKAGSSSQQLEGVRALAVGELSRLQFQRAGEPASDAEFVGPEGEPLTLADFSGKVLVVNFWGTTCAPCVIEMPTLGELQAAFSEDELVVLPLSFDRVGDYPAAAEELAELTDGRLNFYGDSARHVMFDSYIGGFPSTIIYDRAGNEIARFEGDTNWSSEESIAFFERVTEAG
ncbi:TlpA disulfide reductase family protein [Ponticaulis sp.]|uniref:TlpA family protein disulfide reductase n=1 Tax=Ponticaulis sp. TaxID=2020902 RepID=UPI000B717180|nr:TlpA disulfide reductase family protein [Ponticaulis sp.]MAI89838.1 hypothetical protein [Ponticaulis sp.]OUX99513.1 MAG: hypothetical protein CBB65_05305 [Hyphomonadaceae bacterium TMED5]|tara:strand:+ start:70295 stop:70885 length:591 start_codon:yes stop_codon:yes gene_type:complete